MPVYQYKCARCYHVFEERMGYDHPAEIQCPECGGASAQQFSAPIIFYNTDGFYSTGG